MLRDIFREFGEIYEKETVVKKNRYVSILSEFGYIARRGQGIEMLVVWIRIFVYSGQEDTFFISLCFVSQ